MSSHRPIPWLALAFTCVTLSGCAKSEVETGAAPDRGDDTSAVTTEVDTATGTWDTTSTTGDGNVEPSDTALTPTTPSDTTADQYPVEASLPQFPWPPPRPTTRYVIPFRLLPIGPSSTLGDVYDRLIAALDHGQIEERSVHARDTTGFVLIARIESIGDDGQAKPGPQRWQATPPQPGRFTLSDYFGRLFKAQPGRYRVIALVVTGNPVITKTTAPTAGYMEGLVVGGGGLLPEEYRILSAHKAHCEALIYEFFRSSAASEPKLVTRSSITPIQHLAGAGLWSRNELRP